jgi:hypothetical protein
MSNMFLAFIQGSRALSNYDALSKGEEYQRGQLIQAQESNTPIPSLDSV